LILSQDKNQYGFDIFHQDSEILRFVNHPNYTSPKKYFDIALIELAEVLTFNNFIQPACLYTVPDEKLVGKKAVTTGWGVIETGEITCKSIVMTIPYIHT
jgi:hypothetical protein